MENYHAVEESKEWIASFVIRHNICPFAKQVFDQNAIGYFTETLDSFEELAISFMRRIATLTHDTAFIIYRTQFPDFLEFLDFYYACEAILEDSEYNKNFQIVAFHPQYLFAGEDESDPANLTNRSPFPMIHILRRSDVEKAVAHFGDTSQITERNIEFLRTMKN